MLGGDLAGDLLVDALVLLALQEDPDAVRVAQDPLDLLGRGGLVDGDHGRAHEPPRVIGQRPLVAGRRHDRDPFTVLDARGDEALGQGLHLGEELSRRDVLPLVAEAAAQGHTIGVRRGLGKHLVGEPALGDLLEQWCF